MLGDSKYGAPAKEQPGFVQETKRGFSQNGIR